MACCIWSRGIMRISRLEILVKFSSYKTSEEVTIGCWNCESFTTYRQGDWQTVYCQTDIRHRYIGSLMVLRRLLQVCFSTRIARQPDNVIRSLWELCYYWEYDFAMKYLYVCTFVIKLKKKRNIKFLLSEFPFHIDFNNLEIRCRGYYSWWPYFFLQRMYRFNLLFRM